MSLKKLKERKARQKERRQQAALRNQEDRALGNTRQAAIPPGFPIRVEGRAGRISSRSRNRRVAQDGRGPTPGLIQPLLPDPDDYPVEVSIIFGTYNRISHLRSCVASIRTACAGLEYEIIVCDGGSNDGSTRWLQEQPDVKYIGGALDGAVKAFNACFRVARGRFILNLNDDAALHPLAVKNGLKHFADPMVGQVAFPYAVGTQAFHVEHAHSHTYVNYGLTRANVARAIEKICGGFWAPVYYTYGGDTELSMWVHRLGYKVIAATDAKVIDKHAQDGLRRRSHDTEKGKSGRVFGTRWPSEIPLKFRGPAPGVTGPELAVLHQFEAGEPPSVRWPRLTQVDPELGEFPPQSAPRPERVLHVHLRTDEDPQDSLAQALRKLGTHGYGMVDWLRFPNRSQRENAIRDAVARLAPTLIFMQLQGDHISPQLVRQIRSGIRDPSLAIVLWCGDVGTTNGPWSGFSDGWSHAMAREVDAMLYTGTGQVTMHRARGMQNAAYLQIGFEESRYGPAASREYGRQHDVVFMGQNYGPQWDVIPQNEAQLRRDVVSVFRKKFKRFGIYGTRWGRASHLHQSQAAGVYHRSLMAISVSLTSQLGRYTSDRMIRSMACGTPTLVKRFVDMEGMGLVHGENVLAWDTVDEAVTLARDWLRPARHEELLKLGRAGAELMRSHHTWVVRMHELSAILKALRGQRDDG